MLILLQIIKYVIIGIGIILFVLVGVILLLCFFPFEYFLNISYEKRDLNIDLDYIFFKMKFYLHLGIPIVYNAKLWNIVILDSKKIKKEEKEKNTKKDSIADTGFIKNKNLEKSVEKTENAVIDLLSNAKSFKLKQDKKSKLEQKEKLHKKKEVLKSNTFAFLDLFNIIFPRRIIEMWKLVAAEFIKILEFFAPIQSDVNVKFGTGNPFMTGIMLSIFAPIHAALGKNVTIKPNFDKAGFSGKMLLIGRPYLICPIIVMFRLYLNKDFRELVLKKK